MQILILGATSSIARACANEFATCGNNLYLASRDTEEVARIAQDLKIRHGIKVNYSEFDAEDFASHQNFWQKVLSTMGRIDGILVVCGYLGNNQQVLPVINRNFTGVVSILNIAANYLREQKQGFIIGLSSVAGDRGRQSNYVYGSAKAALTTYLQGLRNDLFATGIKVLTVKLGIVDTAMTFSLDKKPFVVPPEYIGKKIVYALNCKKDVIYLPWFWQFIMLVIKSIPEFIFKRLKL